LTLPLRVVFDFGGVLFNWQPLPLLCQRLAHRGVHQGNADAWARRIFHSSAWADFDRGTVALPALVQRIVQATGLPAAEVQGLVDAIAPHLLPVAPTVVLLQRLHAAGVRLHYLSNMPAPLADHLEQHHPMLQWFESGVFSARVQLIKPEPALYALAQQRFGAQPQELVFLDDHLPNVQAARAAGWQALHFTDAAACEAGLRAAGVSLPPASA
jgi:putative hydrolase of the HAD superfamily